MQTHKNLKVWQRGISFVTEIYRITQDFPKEEIYCMALQLRRAAISIPSNIAEGSARKGWRNAVRTGRNNSNVGWINQIIIR
jgi:four helix bundle protein